MRKFSEQVCKIVKQIPEGKTLTYKKVAALVGNPGAYRAVGNILNKNYDSKIPCHRVIRSDGQIGGYNRGEREKIKKLNKEGFVFRKMSAIFRSENNRHQGSKLN